MSTDAWMVVDCLFQTIWTIFTGWHIPGTTITPASAFAFLICAAIGMRFIGRILGESIDIEEGYRAGHAAQNAINRRIAHRELTKPLSTNLRIGSGNSIRRL